MKRFIPYIFVILITAMTVIFPEDAIASARHALSLCAEVIVPSLFPFFVCSGLLIYSGVSEGLSRFSGPVMKPLFNVSGCGSAALVLGLLSGYPLGAVCACQLYESGYLSKSETERLLAFCNNSGPLFILGAVGTAIYSSRRLGLVLYFSHILAALFVGVVFRFYDRNRHSAPEYRITQPEMGFSEVFSSVLANSVSSILTVSGAVVFFGVVSGAATQHLPLSGAVKAFIIGIFELTGGTEAISRTNLPLLEKLVMSAGVVGFAGLSVHLQVAAIVAKHHLSLLPYFLGKLLHAVLAALFTFSYFYLFEPVSGVFASAEKSMSAGFCMSSVYMAASILFVTVLIICFGVLLKMKKLLKEDRRAYGTEKRW